MGISVEDKCRWWRWEGRRRRRWWSRRRSKKECNYKKVCDRYVRGRFSFKTFVFRVRLEFKYYIKTKAIRIGIVVGVWLLKWVPAMDFIIWRHGLEKNDDAFSSGFRSRALMFSFCTQYLRFSF